MTTLDNINEFNNSHGRLDKPASSGPFEVPAGYFDGLAASVMSRIKEQTSEAVSEIKDLSPLLSSIPRVMPYDVPNKYFDNNLEGLPAFFGEQESVVLSFVTKAMPYSVPTGYFANFADTVLARTGSKGAKIVSMGRPRWMRIATAAVMAGIIGISGLLYFNSGKRTALNSTQAMAQSLTGVSNDELDNFIKASTFDADNSAPETSSTASNDIKALVKDVSEKELDDFLDQFPDEDDLTLN